MPVKVPMTLPHYRKTLIDARTLAVTRSRELKTADEKDDWITKAHSMGLTLAVVDCNTKTLDDVELHMCTSEMIARRCAEVAIELIIEMVDV